MSCVIQVKRSAPARWSFSERRASRTRLALASIAFALAASACGFRLQGRTPLPPSLASVYLQTEGSQTDFVANLRKSLVASGVRLVPDSSEASAAVRILEDQAMRRVLSVSATNIPREYEITYKVRYEVTAQDLLLAEWRAVT